MLITQALRIKREIFRRVGVHNVGARKWLIKHYADKNQRGKKKKRRNHFQAGHDAPRAHLAALIERCVMAIETTHAGVFADCADGLSPSNVLMDIAT